jgi:hypothetical protein
VVVSGGRRDLIAATQRVLANQLHRDVGIARFGQVTETSSANEAAFALRIEPADRLAIGNYLGEWCTRLVAFTALAAALLLSTTTLSSALAAATTTLSASALIATAASVVAIIAMAFALMLALAASATALTLRIVLRLRL